MKAINVGDKYYLVEADGKTLLELTVKNVLEKDNIRLIFFISDNSCDFWNGAYSVEESNIGQFIFSSKEEALSHIIK